MSTSTASDVPARSLAWERAADYLELTKPKIVRMELVTVAVAAVVASSGALDLCLLAHALFGTIESLASDDRFRRPYVLHLGARAQLRAIVLFRGDFAAPERPNGPRADVAITDLSTGLVASADRRPVSVLEKITRKRGSMPCANTQNESAFMSDARSRR